MENINAVQKAMQKYGVPVEDLFQTVDLFEKRNIPAVTSSIMALGRTCYLHPEFKGPFLGNYLIVSYDTSSDGIYNCDAILIV